MTTKSLSPERSLGSARHVVLAALLLSFLPLPSLVADGFIYVPEPGPIPGIGRRPHFPLEVTRHRVKVEIDENVARTRVEETFHNRNPRQLEGTYLFPLPPEAAIADFTMKINGKEVAGEVLEKEKAREIYESIVRKAQDPGLLEYVERGLFRARVFPIPPQGDVDVAIEYVETLPRTAGATQYLYPLNTGKYSAGDYKNVAVDLVLRSKTPIHSIHCPSHEKVSIDRRGDREARVTFEAATLRADKDFLLTWNVGEDALAPFLLTHRDNIDPQGFFMMSIKPNIGDQRTRVSKDVVFVIDTSGSMQGHKLEQAKKALIYCLRGLNPGDRFNIVDFSSEARKLSDLLLSVDDENRRRAIAYIEAFKARGGTNIDEGLRIGLSDLKEPGRLQLVVFLTDGEPTIGRVTTPEILQGVAEKNFLQRRVFVFGVGEDLNAKLLDTLARETRGATQYIRSNENIEVPLSNFYDKIDSPILTDVTLDVRGDVVTDLYPRSLPDLFHGDQLEVFGRYLSDGPKTVVVRGKLLGSERVFEYSLPFNGGKNSFLPKLWASRKVGHLIEQMRLSGESKEVKDEVVRLSKRYGILTPYTSYLILEEAPALTRRGLPAAPLVALRVGEQRERLAQEAADGFDSSSGGSSVAFSRDLAELKKGQTANVQGFLDTAINADRVRVKEVGGRVFYLQRSLWVDSALTSTKVDAQSPRRVKYLSGEYFTLLRSDPQIGQLLSVGREVTFRWRDQVIMVEG